MIDVRNVSRSYHRNADEVHALDNVSVHIEAGHFVAFMGPSGSGKSTLLNLISGIDRPNSGDVLVVGQRLNDLSEDELAHWRARHVGLIFQFFNLIPVLSARDNVALPLLLTPLKKAERARRAETALRVVGLDHRMDHSPRTLSGGEQQRVAIARAIVTDPDLIVADEPTGDLDARNAEDILALLRQLKNDFGKTIVMVTHDSRALRFVDDALHLDKGVLLEGEDADRAAEAIRIAAGGAARQ
ncbi:MAG: ABC transporter ATP-binding protein [Deltaproteobacteria bacterium]|nr:ABC transporter ATP-binding protein [Deltaproteobacteria bacterium]MBI3387831.1 ABC transporter ATP-binding protein [Deltaproteobacteria bacterium]